MWKEIISKDTLLHDNVADFIYKIRDHLKENGTASKGLISGIHGNILFSTYLSELIKGPESVDVACNDLGILFDELSTTANLNFSEGIAGGNFLINHLKQKNIFDFSDTEIDPELFADFIKRESTFDYLHGNTGVILSMLESDHDTKIIPYIKEWLRLLENKNESDSDELKFKIDYIIQVDGTSDPGYCIGLAHGVPSILIVLLKIIKKYDLEEAKILAHKSFNFLIKCQYDIINDFYFPSTISNGIKNSSRLAWCYGDLGCAIAIFQYGKYFQKQECIDFANEVFLKHAYKRDPVKCGLRDADFCHGTLGVAHIYARMYNYTGLELFRETAEYWYSETLKKATFEDGACGYKHFGGVEKGWTNESGLLEGISGIGLSLISAISDIEPKWDSAFLLS